MNRPLAALLVVAALGLAAGCSTPAAEGPGTAFTPAPTTSEYVMPTEQPPLTGTAPADGGTEEVNPNADKMISGGSPAASSVMEADWLQQYPAGMLTVEPPIIKKAPEGQWLVTVRLTNPHKQALAAPSVGVYFDDANGNDLGSTLWSETVLMAPGETITVTMKEGAYKPFDTYTVELLGD